MMKRALAMLLALVLLLGLVPMGAFAEDGAAAPELTGLEIMVGGNTTEAAAAIALTEDFSGDKTQYSTAMLDYQESGDKRYVWVKATAPEGVTLTATCGDSLTSELTSGQWGLVQKEVPGPYIWSAPVKSGPLETGTNNTLTVTLSQQGREDRVYTVTIPMQVDLTQSNLLWKTNLEAAVYYRQGAEATALTVEAQYRNRPLGNENPIVYQWYESTDGTAEGTALEGETGTAYTPDISDLGTRYYYATASCEGTDSIFSTVQEVTVTDHAAPESITITTDYPYTVPSTYPAALAGVSYVAKKGDTLQFRALDENGEPTPVKWSLENNAGGTLDQNGLFTVTSSSNSYIHAVSLYDPAIAADTQKNLIPLTDYAFSDYNKTASVTLSTDGQTDKTLTTSGGVDGATVWSYTLSGENIATLTSDLSKKGKSLAFTALRPGTIDASFTLDLDGAGAGHELTDSAQLSIKGIAVEDAAGNLKRTNLELSSKNPNPTVQLQASSFKENPTFTWKSGDETVAVVDQTGLVTAKGVGSVIISAADGTYTGGIRVVVSSADTPYLDALDFATTTYWSTGLSNGSWRSNYFQAAKLDYTGLTMTQAAASSLTLTNTTSYNTQRWTAVASYTDVNGKPREIPVASGEETVLPDLPFGTGIITITLTDKENGDNRTSYTFQVTRPRATDKAILTATSAANGLTFQPEGRELIKDELDGKTEGKIYRANSDGTLAQYVGTASNCYYYRTYAMNGLKSFRLTVRANSAYGHLRLSTDGGTTWTDLGQSGAAGQSTGLLTFPEAQGEENPAMQVQFQILDDKTYSENVAAGKDGFADATPNTYTLWVEQLSAAQLHCDMETALSDTGDWYPAFDKDRMDYKLIVPPEGNAPVVTFTVSDQATVLADEKALTPGEDGRYTLTLTTQKQTIRVTSGDGAASRSYSFSYSPRDPQSAATRVVDYLPMNSQYTNGNNNGYGIAPYLTLTGGDVRSLGNFGGYITFYLEQALTDDPANPYGVDFYVDGNSFVDTTTSGGLAAMEPGQVWVSEDGETWYALAGSEHYEDSTRWDYSVTYTRVGTDGVSWVDSDGQTNITAGHRTFSWPSKDIYPWNTLIDNDTVTLTGVLLPCVDGTTTGKDNFASTSKGALFGYVDVMPNGTNNPYLENSRHTNTSSGFDLAWAVDDQGTPVDVSGKSFHYVKVVTASNLQGGAVNEKSTEVSRIVRAEAAQSAVGVTTAPTGVTVTCGGSDKTISFREGQQVYSLDVGSAGYVSVLVNGTDAEDNIYINNQRVTSGTAAAGIKVSGEKLVRVLVQNGQKEPVIYLLKLTGTSKTELIDGVKLTVLGADELASTVDGIRYTATVGYRVGSIAIQPDAPEAAVTIDGQPVQDSYELKEGENTFTIQATRGSMTQTVTLVVTREKAPVSTGKIKVTFTLLGDDCHGKYGTRHTLADGNLKTWIPEAEYELDAPAKVIDLIELALKDKYTIENPGGNYISAIGDLGEFDNGKNSGWMYTLNGSHPPVGVASQLLAEGDVVVLHYTDDYTYEEDGVNFGKPNVPETVDVTRVAGDNRHDTALKIADEMKAALGAEKFNAILIASGYNFADALAGSYLSAVKNAPILLSYGQEGKYAYLDTNNMDYIRENLAEGGTVYILGGTSAVPALYEEELPDEYHVERLGGKNRFETNRKILQEAGVSAGGEILVCTSQNFADSLSASATGKPILLVTEYDGKLYGVDDDFLNTLRGSRFTIIGGIDAVNQRLEDTLRTYGTVVERLSGKSRFETSVKVAERYFLTADSAVVAYAWDFPDGLCGGALAHAAKVPLILTMDKYQSAAKEYLKDYDITDGIVLGGAKLVSDDTVRDIFALDDRVEIPRK